MKTDTKIKRKSVTNSNYYITPTEIWAEMKNCNMKGRLSESAIEMMRKIAIGITRNKPYRCQEDKEDCINGGICDVAMYWRNFLPYNKLMIKELIKIELWMLNEYEFCSKESKPDKSLAPDRIFIRIDNKKIELKKSIVDNKQIFYVGKNGKDKLKYSCNDVYPLIEWSEKQKLVRETLYTTNSIQKLDFIPQEIRDEYAKKTRSDAFSFFTQVVKCGVAKQFKEIYKVNMGRKVSINGEGGVFNI